MMNHLLNFPIFQQVVDASDSPTTLVVSNELQLFKIIVESHPDSIFIFNQNWSVIYANKTALQLLEYSETELKKLPNFLGQIDLFFSKEKINEMIQSLLNKETPFLILESLYQSKLEKQFHVELNIQLCNCSSDNLLIVNCKDISHYKLTEFRLKQSEERFALAVQGSNDGIWDWDLVKNKLYISNRWKSLFGYDDDELMNPDDELSDIIHPDDVKAVYQNVTNYIEKKIEYYRVKFRVRHKLGHFVWVLGRGVALWNEEGKAIRIVGTTTNIDEMKRNEERLERALAKINQFKALLDLMADEVFICTTDLGQLVYVNQAAIKSLGYSIADLLQVSPITFIKHPTESIQKIFEPLLTNQCQKLIVEVYHQHQKGFLLPVESSLQFISFRDKQHLLIIARNIQERKHVESKLREQEVFLRLVIENIPQYIFWKNRQSKFLGGNKHFLDILALNNEEELIGKDDFDLHWHEQAAGFFIREQRIMNTGRAEAYTEEFLTMSGEMGYAYVQKIPLFNEHAEVIGLLGTAQDVTEKLKEEIEMKRLMMVLEYSPNIICSATLEGDHFYINPAGRELLGINIHQIKNIHLSNYMTGEDYQFWQQHIYPILSKTGYWRGEFRFQNIQTKELIDVDYSLFFTVNKEGKQVSISSISRDIRTQKHVEIELLKAKESAENANTAKSAFLANMSHELRTPLNGILGYTQLLLADPYLIDSHRECVSIIQRSGNYLLTLINDVLDLAKVEANKIELQPTIFNLNIFFDELSDLFRMRASQKQVEFSCQKVTTFPNHILADEKRLRQILINLLSNSIKFTNHGSVTLKVSYAEGMMTFEVEDTGIGIASEDLEKVFELFKQVGDVRYHNEGTGLGLAITKRLVEMMGGQLLVHSQLGVGSCFWFSIPLKPIEETELSIAQNTEVKLPLTYQGAQRCILIVDDWFDNRSFLKTLLSPLGFLVREAANGQEGLEKALIDPFPDLILLDLAMPVMNGVEMAKIIREHPLLKHIPIIAISAHLFKYQQQDILNVGCDAFLIKPVQIDILLDKIKQLLTLTWVYSSESVLELEKKQTIECLSITTETVLQLSPESRRKMKYLASMGDVLELQKQLNMIEKEQGSSTFLTHLKQLIKVFAFDDFIDILEKNKDKN